MALTPQDKTTKTLRHESAQSHGGCKGACEVYHNVALGQTCGTRLVGGNVPGRSSIHYAASAFTNPSGWLDHRETEANAEAIAKANTCTSKDLPSFGKAVGSLKAAAVNDNAIARQVDSCWKAKEMDGIDLKATVVWQYFGSANGVFRSMPGHTVENCVSTEFAFGEGGGSRSWALLSANANANYNTSNSLFLRMRSFAPMSAHE